MTDIAREIDCGHSAAADLAVDDITIRECLSQSGESIHSGGTGKGRDSAGANM